MKKMNTLLLVLVSLAVFCNGQTSENKTFKYLLIDDQFLMRTNAEINALKNEIQFGKVNHRTVSTLLPCFRSLPSTCNKVLKQLPDLKLTTMSHFELEIYSVYALFCYTANIGRKISVLNQKDSLQNYTLLENNALIATTETTPKEVEVDIGQPHAISFTLSDKRYQTKTIVIKPTKKQMSPGDEKITTNVKVEAVCASVKIFASNAFNKTFSAYYTYEASDFKPGWIRSPSLQVLYLTFLSKVETNATSRECNQSSYTVEINPKHDQDKVPNPCRQTDMINETRFKHPESSSKFIECKATEQMEIFDCPTNYTESQKGCGEQILFNNTVLYTDVNPCTRHAIRNGIFYSANPSNKTSFIQCTEWGTAFLMYCSKNTYWSQYSYACVDVYTDRSSGVNPYRFFNIYICLCVIFYSFIHEYI